MSQSSSLYTSYSNSGDHYQPDNHQDSSSEEFKVNLKDIDNIEFNKKVPQNRIIDSDSESDHSLEFQQKDIVAASFPFKVDQKPIQANTSQASRRQPNQSTRQNDTVTNVESRERMTLNNQIPPIQRVEERPTLSQEEKDIIQEISTKDIYLKIRPTFYGANKMPKGKAVQLIKLNRDKQFEICPEGAQILRDITQKVSIVSIAGPQRSGKSFLLNMLTNSQKNGFQVGNSQKPCTEGIWIWGSPIDVNGTAVLFLDAEGSASVQQSTSHDGKIFALVILISSIFIYNSRGVIDEHAINQLSMACFLSDFLSFQKPKGSNKEAEIAARIHEMAPKFIWVLRDFHLVLEDRGGNKLSATQYLDKILKFDSYHGRNAEMYRQVREQILTIFKDRQCVTFTRPVNSEKQLQNLNDVPFEKLKPEFLQSIAELQSLIFEDASVKRINGTEVPGRILLGLLERYIDTINSGGVSNIYSSWEAVLQEEYDRILSAVKVKYAGLRDVDIINFPYEEEELIEKLHQAKTKAFVLFEDCLIRDDIKLEQCRDEFEVFFQTNVETVLESNRIASEAFCDQLVNRYFKPIFKNVQENYYTKKIDLLEVDWNKALQKYHNNSKGPAKLKVLLEFTKKYQHRTYNEILKRTMEEEEREYVQKLKELDAYRKKADENLDKYLGIDDRIKQIRELVLEMQSSLGLDEDDPHTATEELLERAMHKMLLELRQKTKLDKKRLELEQKLEDLRSARKDTSHSESNSKSSKKACACCIIYQALFLTLALTITWTTDIMPAVQFKPRAIAFSIILYGILFNLRYQTEYILSYLIYNNLNPNPHLIILLNIISIPKTRGLIINHIMHFCKLKGLISIHLSKPFIFKIRFISNQANYALIINIIPQLLYSVIQRVKAIQI